MNFPVERRVLQSRGLQSVLTMAWSNRMIEQKQLRGSCSKCLALADVSDVRYKTPYCSLHFFEVLNALAWSLFDSRNGR